MYARALAAAVLAVVLSVGGVVAPAEPASAHVGTDARLTEILMAISINGVRADHGLPPLHFDGALSDSARAWSGYMASRQTLMHSRLSGWSAMAENVGAAYHPPTIQDMFLASAPHRANILGNYTHMGIGVVVDRAGKVWMTERFAR